MSFRIQKKTDCLDGNSSAAQGQGAIAPQYWRKRKFRALEFTRNYSVHSLKQEVINMLAVIYIKKHIYNCLQRQKLTVTQQSVTEACLVPLCHPLYSCLINKHTLRFKVGVGVGGGGGGVMHTGKEPQATRVVRVVSCITDRTDTDTSRQNGGVPNTVRWRDFVPAVTNIEVFETRGVC
jgi:hypothetical protein